MPIVVIKAQMRVSSGDMVRYSPPFYSDYRNELAEVSKIIDDSKNLLEQGPSGTPYWVEVLFNKDKERYGKKAKKQTMRLQYFTIEEVRQSIARR